MTVTRRTALKALGAVGATAAMTGHVHAVGEHEDDEREDDEREDDERDAEDEDEPTETAVRIAHFAPDAPDVDVYVDGDQVLADVSYGTITDYLEIAPGTYTVRVTPSEEDAADPDEPDDAADPDDHDDETDTDDDDRDDDPDPDDDHADPDVALFEGDVTFDQEFYTAAAIGLLEPGDQVDTGHGEREVTREFTVVVAVDGRAAVAEVDEPVDEPAEIPPGANCPVCNMIPAEYPDWNAQLVHEDGERAYFCTSGCLAAYYAVPERFDAPDAAIVGVWVTDFETREEIDGLEATYVLELDADRVDDPMMRNPLPFADPANATAYVDQYADLDEGDVVTIEAFDRELAETYRPRFFEDEEPTED